METNPVLAAWTPAAPSVLSRNSYDRLVEAFLAGRNARTLRAYTQDLEDFRRFVGTPTLPATLAELLGRGHGEANALLLAYRAALLDRHMAPATINRRLAAVRSLGKLARTLGLIPWALEVGNIKAERYRDTRGPGRAVVCRVLHELEHNPALKARRDYAILRLLSDLALRRGEVVSLDVEHVSFATGMVSILGKGRTSREWLTLPAETHTALKEWMQVRGEVPGPLFCNVDRAKKGQRFTPTSLWRLTKRYGLGRPHGLRHTAITEALALMGGDFRAVQRFSRHKDPRVLNLYDDNRTDLGGEVARRLAASFSA